MRSGLLWYNNSNKSLLDSITDAATRYQAKFGIAPNICFVHPRDLPADSTDATKYGLTLLAKPTILPHHLWLGCKDS